jgi:hypothetical protein
MKDQMTRMSIEVIDTLVDINRKFADVKLKISFYVTDDEGRYKLKGTVDSGWMHIGGSMVIPFDGVEYDEKQLQGWCYQ